MEVREKPREHDLVVEMLKEMNLSKERQEV